MASPAAVRWIPSAAALATSTCVYSLDPVKDTRWQDFTEQHPEASVFHSSQWLGALARTYGYQPVAYSTSNGSERLENAIVFCRVESWLTGRRLVSLPFSDHCAPLATPAEAGLIMTQILQKQTPEQKWRYVEIRPLVPMAIDSDLHCTNVSYAFHELDLSPNTERLFRNLHKNSIQRKIHRAEREKLVYCEGSNEELLDQFYRLFKLTRQRHRIPPQPRTWFRNLMSGFGPALKIRVALREDRPVAAMITLKHKDTMVYKYGCSDARFNNLGGMPMLFWKSIEEAKNAGLRRFDFGRTDADQQGLITFKNRWGATQKTLTYARYGAAEHSTHLFDISTSHWKSRAGKYLVAHMPSRVAGRLGAMLYGHIG